jgi:hypothetical protein
MLKPILVTIKDTLSFLKTGTAPANTSSAQLEKMKETNHLTSKKFYVVATSFVALTLFYFASVAVLFLLPQHNELIGGYVTIFTKTIEVLAIIIASYLGVQAAVDLKYGSTSHASFEATTPAEKIMAEETTKFESIYAGDKSYAPIKWIMKYEQT